MNEFAPEESFAGEQPHSLRGHARILLQARLPVLCCIALVFLVSASRSAFGADASGVSPQAISLPSGPGSIEGLGEKFQPQINSGTFNYQVPLNLPPVRGGAPALVLEYNPGNENGMLGMGWALKVPYITRQTDKGLPQYTNSDLYCDEYAEELVHLIDGSYRQKIESLFIRYQQTTNGGWVANLPNGTLLSFGSTDQSRLDWNGVGTFRWMVDSSQDRNGNLIQYFYIKDGQQIYPSEIRYGLHATQPSSYFSVLFGYINRADPFVDCRPRFACTNRLLLQNVTVNFGSRTTRQWRFAYTATSPVSLLASITEFGDNRSRTDSSAQANVDFLPPTLFGYTPFAFPQNASPQTIGFDDQEPNFSFDGEGSGGRAEFVDINHDGLPDILINGDNTWRSLINPGAPTSQWPVSQTITNPPPVTGAALGQPGVRLVDLNGDGKAKLVLAQDNAAIQFYYYDFASPNALSVAQTYQSGGDFSLLDPEVQFADMDDDKAMDLISLDQASSGLLEVLYTRGHPGQNNHYGQYSMPSGGQFDFTGAQTQTTPWQLADMNGDRLQDMVQLNGTDSTKVCLNLGWGGFGAPYTMTGGPDETQLQASGNSGPRLVDLNQDGLADLVIVENARVQVWLNQNGTNWSGPFVITNAPPYETGQTAVRFVDINANGSVDIIWHQNQDRFIQYIDLFPAGKAYLLNQVITTLGRTLSITYSNSTDFLVQDAGGANRWTNTAPFSMPVISQIVEGDGLGGTYTNLFRYRNDYYDAAEHQFRGFQEATQTERGSISQGAPTLVTHFQFDVGQTNEALKGKATFIETDTDAGKTFYRQTNTWNPRPIDLALATDETRTVTFAFVNDEVIEEIEQGPETNAVTMERAFDYDNYGNQTLYSDFGRVENGDRPAWKDERIYVRQFSAGFPSGTNLWLLDRLVQQDTMDISNHVVARQQVYYDDPAFIGNNLGTVSLGNPTLVRDWINITNRTYRDTVRRLFDTFGNVTTLYDPLGVPSQPSLGHYREIAFDSQIHTHPVMETIYTGNPDVVAAGSTQTSLVMRAEYDIGLGVMTSATEFNTNTTLFGLDTFGRITSITKPYDTTNLPTAIFSYELQSDAGGGQTINYVETDLREVAGEARTFALRSFFDGMGRKVMTRTQSETNGVVVVNDATLFNQRRAVWRSFLPYFEMGTLDFNPINQSDAYLETDYDPLGRETVKSQPPTPPETYRAYSQTTYGPLTRLVRDEEQTRPNSPHYGAGMFYVEDGLRGQDGHGRLRQVEEIVHLTDIGQVTTNTFAWLTEYDYDTLDNVLGYTDSQNNRKSFQFDGLSRKVAVDDPDGGTLQWFYDPASNVTNTVDAKGQQIVYTYDGANRLQTENYLNGQPLPPWRISISAASVVYHYDLPRGFVDNGDGTVSTATNTLGKLAWVEDLSGEEHTSYDDRGRVSYTIKRLPDLQFLYASNAGVGRPLVSYRTSFAYDSLDRMTSLTYPDNDAISYIYNQRNVLQSIKGGVNGLTQAGAIIENISYQASAQVAGISYGNGIVTQYGYDPRLRLISITAAPKTNFAAPLIAFSYAFDDASNIKLMYDNRPTTVVPVRDSRRNTQVFGYDDLYRITFSGYAFGAPGDTNINGGSIAYHYDRIGNMLDQTSTILDADPLTGLPVANLGQMISGGTKGSVNRIGRAPGDPPGPHALTTINPATHGSPQRSYPYDANGNMTVIDGLTNTWDFKDRLTGVQHIQMSAQYLYDYGDRRVAKNVGYPPGTTNTSLTTLYVNKYFEVRENDQTTKFVWNGDTRVARVIGSLSNNQRIQRLRLWTGMNLVSVAVNGATLPVRGNLVVAAYLWDPASLSWQIPSGSLAAGSVLWLQSRTNGTLALTGTYTDPTSHTVSNVPSFLAATGLESFALSNLTAQLSTSQWHYDGKAQVWQNSSAVSSNIISSVPQKLSPGDVLVVGASRTAELASGSPVLRVHYIHQNHLGSTSAETAADGSLTKEVALYPYGHSRYSVQMGISQANYDFIQKESDSESGLHYFEARFLSSDLARFTRVDPRGHDSPLRERLHPCRLHSYAYCADSPLAHLDRTGCDEELPTDSDVDFSQQSSPSESEPRPDPVQKVNNTIGFVAGVSHDTLKGTGLDSVGRLNGASKLSYAFNIGSIGFSLAYSTKGGAQGVTAEAVNQATAAAVDSMIAKACPGVMAKGGEAGCALGVPEGGVGCIPGFVIGSVGSGVVCYTTSAFIGAKAGEAAKGWTLKALPVNNVSADELGDSPGVGQATGTVEINDQNQY